MDNHITKQTNHFTMPGICIGTVFAGVLLLAAASSASAQPPDCDPNAVRPGLCNPLGDGSRRAIRRDDELILFGNATMGDQVNVAFGINGEMDFPIDFERSLVDAEVIMVRSGRPIGPAVEQAVVLTRSISMPSQYSVLIVDPFTEGFPVMSRYDFTPANADSEVRIAVGDLELIKEPSPSDEFHHEVALVYEVDDNGTRRCQLSALSYEDVEPVCSVNVPPAPPTSVTTTLLATELFNQGGAPNRMDVEIGDFDANARQEVVVAVVNGDGDIAFEVFTLSPDVLDLDMSPDTTKRFSGMRITTTSPTSDCCIPHVITSKNGDFGEEDIGKPGDSNGCTLDIPEDPDSCASQVCFVDPFCCSVGEMWDENCIVIAMDFPVDCPCLGESMETTDIEVEDRHFDMVIGQAMDRDTFLDDGQDQIAFAGMVEFKGNPAVHMQIWGFDTDFSNGGGFMTGESQRAEVIEQAVVLVNPGGGDVAVVPLIDSTVKCIAADPNSEGPQFGNDDLMVLFDTNFGPVIQGYRFSGSLGDGGENEPIFEENDFDPGTDDNVADRVIWPVNSVLAARAQTGMISDPPNYFAFGKFLVDRTLQVDEPNSLLISAPSDPDGIGPFIKIDFPLSGPEFTDMPVPLSVFGNPDEVRDIPGVSPIDFDGDNAYYSFSCEEGVDPGCEESRTLFLGEPTLYSFLGVTSVDVMLQEPPKHIDYLHNLGGITNISVTDDFFTQYSTTEQEEATVSRTTQQDFTTSESMALTVSASASVGISGVVGASIETSTTAALESTFMETEQNFESETSSVTLTSVSQAQRDDQLVVRDQILDVWRYPVMGFIVIDPEMDDMPAEEQPEQAYFELMVPGPSLTTFGPGRLIDFYQPQHMNWNILSYPVFDAGTFNPNDVGPWIRNEMVGQAEVEVATARPIWAENSFIVGGLTVNLGLTFQETNVTSQTVTTMESLKESLDFSVKTEVEGSKGIFSGSASAQFDYSVSNMHSTTDTNYASDTTTTNTQLAINVPAGIPPERGYRFFPAWYYTPLGGLKVTHAVSTTEVGQLAQFFWLQNYSLPDAALNMPGRIVADATPTGLTFHRLGTDLSRQVLKGFFFRDGAGIDPMDPCSELGTELFRAPTDGEIVQLHCRIFNLSVASEICNLRVRFEAQEFMFGQEVGPRIPIGDVIIPRILARGQEVDKDSKILQPCEGVMPPGVVCLVDMDGNSEATWEDVGLFVQTLLDSGPCVDGPLCCAGDTNGDTMLDGDDIAGFVSGYLDAVSGKGGGGGGGFVCESPFDENLVADHIEDALIFWDTTGFGPAEPFGLRQYLVYVTLDPEDEINEVHELVDRFNDPLIAPDGTPLDPVPGMPGLFLEKGQNNTGWASIAVAPQPPDPFDCEEQEVAGGIAKRYAPIHPDVRMTGEGLAVQDLRTGEIHASHYEAYVNEPVQLRLTIHADKADPRFRMVKIFEQAGEAADRLIAMREVRGVDSVNGTVEYVTWHPREAGTYELRAVYDESSDDVRKGNASDKLVVTVKDRPELEAARNALSEEGRVP